MSRRVFDGDGNPVVCREAVAKRDAPIRRLGSSPHVQSAFDQILHRFGHDAVVEVTAGSRQAIWRSPRATDLANPTRGVRSRGAAPIAPVGASHHRRAAARPPRSALRLPLLDAPRSFRPLASRPHRHMRTTTQASDLANDSNRKSFRVRDARPRQHKRAQPDAAIRIPPSSGGIHLSDLSNFPEPAQRSPLSQSVEGASGGIVCCATRSATERVADFLNEKGYAAGHYHAGLKPESKLETQEQFADGALRVIAATNAFGTRWPSSP